MFGILKNTPITIQNRQYKLNQLASLEKKKTGNTINKNNQQYSLTVAYDFLGTTQLAQKVRETAVENFEQKLPLGYKVFEQKYNRWNKKEKNAILLSICCHWDYILYLRNFIGIIQTTFCHN